MNLQRTGRLLVAVGTLSAPSVAHGAAPIRIPLCAGLTVVTSVSTPDGDVESLKVVDAIDAGGVHVRYSAELPPEKVGTAFRPRSIKEVRTIRHVDLRTAMLYLQWFGTNIPVEADGTTALGPSAAVLARLKSNRESDVGLFEVPEGTSRISADSKQHPNIYDYVETYRLSRAGSNKADFVALVNGTKTVLPAVHAAGRSDFYGYKAEFLILDDEANPLALSFRIGIGGGTGARAGGDRDTLRVTKISYRCGTGPSAIERALAESGRVDVYDIYFSFNSDDIREESEPTLREIADVLRRHPDWRLAVGGHTDAIGGDRFNLELSSRRAAAVKNALVSSFGIAAGRLTTTGYGRSRPVDTNDTEDGRARNRRVELARQ